jgi:hypothetical protein
MGCQAGFAAHKPARWAKNPCAADHHAQSIGTGKGFAAFA